MQLVRTFSLFLLATLLLAVVPSVASADAASERFIKDRQAELTAALRAGQNEKVERTFDAMIDYRVIARDSLGEHWGELDDARRERFVCILRNLVSDAYRRDLETTLDYEVEHRGSSKVENGQLVKTVARSKTDKREEPISIDYVVHRTDEGMKVRDILTSDSSLVRNYKAQFRRIIKKKGFDALVEKMEKKLGDQDRVCPPKSEK